MTTLNLYNVETGQRLAWYELPQDNEERASVLARLWSLACEAATDAMVCVHMVIR